ncbi:MAG: hypothetical protein WAO25_04055, partial [Bacillota bacterium]
KGGRKTATFSKKVVGILPLKTQKAPKTGLQPENVVDSLPPEAVWVVQNLPFMNICSKKSKRVGEIVPPLQGKVVQNLPFMSVCSKKSQSVVEIEPPL